MCAAVIRGSSSFQGAVTLTLTLKVVQASKALMLVMEFVPGGSLSQHVQQAASISQIAALEFVERLASGTAYCHKVGVAHR